MFPKTFSILQILLFSGIIISVNSFELRSSTRSGYEQPCNKTLKCKSQSWFGCDSITNTCLCMKPNEMVYDNSSDKCTVLIGERCIFAMEEQVQNSYYEKADCVSNSKCSPNGITGVCICPNGTYEDISLSHCPPLKSYGEKCARDIECNPDKFLRCINGTCACNPDISIYNQAVFSISEEAPTQPPPPPPTPDYYGRYNHRQTPTTVPPPIVHTIPVGTCLARIKTTCSSKEGKYCVRNAICHKFKNICECPSPFILTSKNLCGLEYDQQCTSTSSDDESGNICSDKLVCTSSNQLGTYPINTTTKCSCPNPDFQLYDTTTKSCRSRVWSPCDPNEPNSCSQKSSCMKDQGKFQCLCDDGYITDPEYKCQKAFGTHCDYTQAVISHENLCDGLSGLQCKKGICSCPNSFDVYDENLRICATPVGVSCFQTAQCVSNANCTAKAQPVTARRIPGRCECLKGFIPQVDGTCIKETVEIELSQGNATYLADEAFTETSQEVEENLLQKDG